MASLADAVRLLEGYRVILLQRPPALAAEDIALLTTLQPEQNDLLPGRALPNWRNSESAKLIQLAELASLSWFVSPHGPAGWKDPVLWKSDFVEVGLQRWRTDYNSHHPSHTWTTLLYHMVHLNLHSNVDLLQRHARLVAKTGRLPSQPSVFKSIDKWRNSRHYTICGWHADNVLEIAKLSSIQYGPTNGMRGSLPILRVSDRTQAPTSEPPHVPFCIYFATLIHWYGRIGREHREDPSSVNMCIETGARLLFQLKAHVATHLGRALYELLMN